MFIIYIILVITFVISVCALYFIIMFDKIYLEARMSFSEFDGVNSLIKRELNMSNSKKLELKDVIEKCDNVNNIWSTISKRNIDISEWAFIFALHYLSTGQFKGTPIRKKLFRQKWKHKHKYFFIYYLKR